MSLEDGRRQKSKQLELPMVREGEAPTSQRQGETSTATTGNARSGTDHLMELVAEASNVKKALKRVESNKGSPGIDGMHVMDLRKHLHENWSTLRKELLSGTYQPMAVKKQEVPKNGGGVRELGIPTSLDRFIQQAILQVLQPRFDPTFSQHSYGFRPGRRAHDAVLAAQQYISGGKTWVVDVDLEKFFDRVNHDVLMSRLATRIEDKRLLRLIRRYLEAGMMVNGVVMERYEGTPQGGPLSPLLANVLLDEVDRELEKRGHAFCRYADDCNVYVGSQRAGERVMDFLKKAFAGLRLKINDSKSAVARPWDRKILGFSFHVTKGGKVKRSIASKSLEKMKKRVREITDRNGGRNIAKVVEELRQYLLGWKAYFGLAEIASVFHELDNWIRRRLRVLQLSQWRRGTTVFKRLTARGIPVPVALKVAFYSRRYWWITRQPVIFIAFPNKLFNDLGVPRLAG